MRSRLVLLATAVVALLVLAWILHPPPRSAAARPAPPAGLTAHSAPPATAEPKAAADVAAAGLRAGDAPSHLADDLNSPTGDIHADLRTLDEIFRQYRSAIHGADPVGDNLDITRVLTGHNSLDFAFIPKDNPNINSQGELCDRWGTPFFFHQLSGTQMEIRSAGPDHKLWTPDDEVLTPGLYVPQR